ncbi:pentapeptide repeat-containing protein [Streptomyces massasporeus]
MSTSQPPAPPTEAPFWPHCAHGADPVTDPVGCHGAHVPGHTACLAHLNDADRTSYLAGLSPGVDIDHCGTPFTEDLLTQLLNALTDPTTHNPHLGTAKFDGALFTGTAGFEQAQFTGTAGFDRAEFSGGAMFRGAQFSGDARFGGVQFSHIASFTSAQFSGGAWFGGAQFSGPAAFGGVQFTSSAIFGGALFTSTAGFFGVQFTGTAGFDEAQFSDEALFGRAHFTGACGGTARSRARHPGRAGGRGGEVEPGEGQGLGEVGLAFGG